MCCCRLYASEKHSEREKKGERWKNGWRLSSLFFLCVLFWALPHIGANKVGEEEGEKQNLTSTLGQETRDCHSVSAFLTIITPKFLCGN